jgi:hypothetical protein
VGGVMITLRAMKYVILILYGLSMSVLFFLEKYAQLSAIRDASFSLFILLIIFDEKEKK